MSRMNQKRVDYCALVSAKDHQDMSMKAVCKPGDMPTRVMGAEIIGNVQHAAFGIN